MKICVFPGTFDPFTKGHKDVALRAAALFPRVIVAVSGDNGKDAAPLEAQKRVYLAKKSLEGAQNIEVKAFTGLLADFCRGEGARVIVRGLRSSNDFTYENKLAFINKRLDPDIETVYLMTSQEHSHISSSTVRELIRLKADIKSFVPPEIAKDLLDMYNR